MVGRECWVLLGDDPKQKFPTGALWLSQHYRTGRSLQVLAGSLQILAGSLQVLAGSLQDPCRLSWCSTMTLFQHSDGGRWGCVSLTYTSVFHSKGSVGTDNITYLFSLYPDGKSCRANCRAYLSCCTCWDQGCKGHNEEPLWYCRASCSPGPITPSVRYRWSIAWITTDFWNNALDFMSLQALKSISCESRYCFFILWNKIQAPLSNVLPLNFDNAYPLKYVISWK